MPVLLKLIVLLLGKISGIFFSIDLTVSNFEILDKSYFLEIKWITGEVRKVPKNVSSRIVWMAIPSSFDLKLVFDGILGQGTQ